MFKFILFALGVFAILGFIGWLPMVIGAILFPLVN